MRTNNPERKSYDKVTPAKAVVMVDKSVKTHKKPNKTNTKQKVGSQVRPEGTISSNENEYESLAMPDTHNIHSHYQRP